MAHTIPLPCCQPPENQHIFDIPNRAGDSWQLTTARLSLGQDEWLQLNDELLQNVQREFSVKREDSSSLFEEHFEPASEYLFTQPEVIQPCLDSSDPTSHAHTMGRPGPLSLDFTAGEMSFIDWYPKGDATISYTNDEGVMDMLTNLNAGIIEARCPLLAQAFEHSRSGRLLYLEALTSNTALPFLRYIYTGTYALNGHAGDFYEDVPTSVLLHCQLYRLGDIYDLADLKTQAYVNVLRQCEFGCSSPDKPIDLCPAIEFLYQHLSDSATLLDTVIGYCLSCFLSHRLGEDVEFRKLAYDNRAFHQALCRESMNRGFENETAAAIIQMPFEPYAPETYASREDPYATRFADIIYHFHGGDEFENFSRKKRRPDVQPGASSGPSFSALSAALRRNLQARREQDEAVQIKKEAEHVGERIYDNGRTSQASKAESHSVEPELDAEYEMVQGPALVEELDAESDSDASSLVLVEHPSPTSSAGRSHLPIRTRHSDSLTTFAAALPRYSNSDQESDSDWLRLDDV